MILVRRLVRFTQGHSRAVMLMAVFALMLMVAVPSFAQATPIALDIPVDTIFESTNSWMTTFAPIAAIGIGITLALAILGFIGATVAKAFKG